MPTSKIEPFAFRLSELLRPEGISLNLRAESVPEAIGQTVALLVRARFIEPADAPNARLSFIENEEIRNTGFKYEIAIPHSRGPWSMGAVIAHYPDGLDWATPDGLPVHLVIGLALPESGFKSYSLFVPQLADILAFGKLLNFVKSASGPSDVISAVEDIEDDGRFFL